MAVGGLGYRSYCKYLKTSFFDYLCALPKNLHLDYIKGHFLQYLDFFALSDYRLQITEILQKILSI